MTPKEFVEAIRKEILDANLDIYRNLFEKTKMESATDAYWKEALSFYECLDGKAKESFYKIIRQVMSDSISNMFAVLDGVSFLSGQEEDFDLSYQGQLLNGDLHDTFLELEEEVD